MFIKRLINFGLTENEAKVYLTALGMGPVLASTLARVSGINRATVYTVLSCLKKKGLMGTYERNNFFYFIAADPEVLVKMGEMKAYAEKAKIDSIIQILPELQFMNKNNPDLKSKIRWGEGLEGIKMIYQNFLKEGKDLWSFWNLKLMPEEIILFLKDKFLPEFFRRNLKLNLFVPEEINCLNLFSSMEAEEQINISLVRTSLGRASVDLMEKRVALMSYQNNINLCNGFYIEDEAVYGTMKTLLGAIFEKKGF